MGDIHEFVLDLDNMTYTDTVVGTQNGSGSSPSYFELDYEVKSFKCLLRYGSSYGNATLTNFEAYFQYDTSSTYHATGIGSDYYDVYNAYIPIKSQLTLTSPNEVLGKNIALGKNGVVVGDGSISTPDNSFADIPAMLYSDIMQRYNNMQPKVLTDGNRYIDKNIYHIPTTNNGTVLMDTSGITNMKGMFSNCTNLTKIPLLDTNNVTNMDDAFASCKSLVEIALLNTSNVTNMSNTFFECTNLKEIPLLDTSKVTTMYQSFAYCKTLTKIPLLNTSNVTDMRYTFEGCTNLKEISLLNTSNVTTMNQTFVNCTSLTEVPLLDTNKVTDMAQMFSSCTNLKEVPLFDTSNVTSIKNMFNYCTSLSDKSLNNILMMCKNATKITSYKTLKWLGLTSEQANKCKTLSNYSVFTSAGWTTGY